MSETNQKSTKSNQKKHEKIIKEIIFGEQEINSENYNGIKKEDKKALKKLAE